MKITAGVLLSHLNLAKAELESLLERQDRGEVILPVVISFQQEQCSQLKRAYEEQLAKETTLIVVEAA